MSKIIQIEFISQYHNYFLAGCFDIDKTIEFIDQKYYEPSLR